MCRVAARNYKSTRAPRRGRARQRKGGRAAVAVHLGSCSLWEREDPPASTGGCEGMAVLGSPGRGGHRAPGVPSERGRRARVFHSPGVRLDARDNNEVVFCATGSAEIMYIAGKKNKEKINLCGIVLYFYRDPETRLPPAWAVCAESIADTDCTNPAPRVCLLPSDAGHRN